MEAAQWLIPLITGGVGMKLLDEAIKSWKARAVARGRITSKLDALQALVWRLEEQVHELRTWLLQLGVSSDDLPPIPTINDKERDEQA